MEREHLPQRQSEWFVLFINGKFNLYPGTLDLDEYFGRSMGEVCRLPNRLAAMLIHKSRRAFRRLRRGGCVLTVFRVSADRFEQLFRHDDGRCYAGQISRYYVPKFVAPRLKPDGESAMGSRLSTVGAA